MQSAGDCADGRGISARMGRPESGHSSRSSKHVVGCGRCRPPDMRFLLLSRTAGRCLCYAKKPCARMAAVAATLIYSYFLAIIISTSIWFAIRP